MAAFEKRRTPKRYKKTFSSHLHAQTQKQERSPKIQSILSKVLLTTGAFFLL